MSDQKKEVSKAEVPNFAQNTHVDLQQLGVVDLCVPHVFAVKTQDFFDVNYMRLPGVICRCECENVEIVRRSISFTCNNVVLCIEYRICLKFFPLNGAPYCQTFDACFTKTIPFNAFKTFPANRPINLEQFLQAQGACVGVELIDNQCLCFAVPGVCSTFIIFTAAFFVVTKLFQERNVIVLGFPVGPPVVSLPREDSVCGLPNFTVEGATCAADAQLTQLPPEDRENYEKARAAFEAQVEEKSKAMLSKMSIK